MDCRGVEREKKEVDGIWFDQTIITEEAIDSVDQ